MLLNFFRLRIFNPECFDSNGLHYLRVKRSVREICISFSDFVYNVHAFDDFTESGILTVEVRSIFMHDKELRASGIRYHSTSHRENAFGVFEVIFKAVHRKFALDVITGTASACTVGAAAL